MSFQVKRILKYHQLVPKHSKGQNFLINESIAQNIIHLADLSANDFVLEIGAGLGALTIPLCSRVERVVAIEWDRNLITILSEITKNIDNLNIIEADALSFNYEDKSFNPSASSFIVLGNLPYYISTALIQKLLPKVDKIKKLVFMVQKEVAERLIASQGKKAYGVLSLITDYYSIAEKILDVSKDAFYPKPKIDSSIVKMTLREKKLIKITNEEFLFSIIKAGFLHRRKTLINSLNLSLQVNIVPEVLKQIFKRLSISTKARAEELSLLEFANLTELILTS